MTVEEIRGNNYDNFPIGMRVLAVDDDPSCLKLLDALLRKCQYQVTTTSQARMALKMLRENRDRFDLIISDVHMPDMDGFKLLELVGLEMDLPVIMLSANSDTKLVMKGISHGACDYLVKPVRLEELRNVWQHVIRRKKSDSKSQNKSNDQDKSYQGGGEGGQGQSLSSNADQDGKHNKKRKDEDDETDENGSDNDDPGTQKKARVVWSIELHRKFVAAVNQLGIEKAVPKRILDLMNVEGLTRENVASHLQKYRLYLKRISSVATQQANMVAAYGGRDSAYMRMGSLDGLGDFRTTVGSGRYAHATLSSYAPGAILGRLNSAAGVSLRNLAASPQLQPSNAQNLSNSISAFAKLNPNIPPSSQNTSLFQGIPSSLELDQLQQSRGLTHVPVDESRLLSADVLGYSDNSLSNVPNNPLLLQGNSQQSLPAGGFGDQNSLSMTPFRSDSFSTGVNGSSNILNHGRSNENWQNSIQLSKFQSSSFPLTESFINSHLPQNSGRDDNSSALPHLQNSSPDFSSTTSVSPPFEDSRGEIQYREGRAGAVQSMNQTPSQAWADNKQRYSQNSNNVFGNLSSQIPNLSHSMNRSNETFGRRMDMSLIGRSNGGSSTLVQHTENENLIHDTRTRSNEDYLLEPTKQQVGFAPQSYDPLDNLVSAMKREQDGGMLEEEQYVFVDYPFGS